MVPVQFSLCQKWTRSTFCSAKSGPGPVFTSPMVDPVQFSLSQKWTCLVFVQPKVDLVPVEFCGTKVGSTYRSLFQIMILSYMFIVLLNSWQRSTCQCCLSLTTLVTCPCQYSHWHTHAVAIRIQVKAFVCLLRKWGSCFNPDATQGFLMVLKHLTRSNMDKSGAGPVFAQPKVGPVQFSLSQKWTQSSFRSAKSGPSPVFVQPKVDPV